MNFDSYIISDTKTATTVLPKCPPPYSHKGFSKLSFKKKAFTLAEVLITLTIIGVVAAMTIPTLMSKYQKHTYVVGLKKAYSQLQNAVKMIPITEGCPSGDYECAGLRLDTTSYGEAAHNTNLKILAKQLKTQEICEKKECQHDWEYHGNSPEAIPHITTADGMIYEFYRSSIGVDVNGKKGPNIVGRDQFSFLFVTKGTKELPVGSIVPYGSKIVGKSPQGAFQYWRTSNWCSVEQPPQWRLDCTGRVLEEDAMNY